MDFWICSDHHFGHANILKFKDDKGNLIRPNFDDVEDMDEKLIKWHNELVGQYDKVYFLGDVSFKLDVYHRVLPRLNGKKRLILGNHDKFNMGEYVRHFEKIYESWQPLRNVVFTHRPILLGDHDHHGKLTINIHGHTHQNIVKDNRYFNMCVEVRNYRPLHWTELAKEIKSRGFEI